MTRSQHKKIEKLKQSIANVHDVIAWVIEHSDTTHKDTKQEIDGLKAELKRLNDDLLKLDEKKTKRN